VETAYDGSVNFLGKDVKKYIGEYLYLEPKAEKLQIYGYEGFIKDYKKSIYNKENIYKCCDSYGSKYEEMAGKYFKVIDVFEQPEANTPKGKILHSNTFYLKLQEKDSKDVLFYQYYSNYESSFPFISVKFYEKQKNEYLGKEYVFVDRYLEGANDL